MDTNLPIVRTGTLHNIDYISFRLLFNRLVYVDNSGSQYATTAAFRVEVKPHSSASWTNPYAGMNLGLTITAAVDTILSGNVTAGAQIPNTREAYVATVAPVARATGAVWFNSLNNYYPKIWNGTTWVAPTALVYTTPVNDYPRYQWAENGLTITTYVGPAGSTPPAGLVAHDLWISRNDSNYNGNDQVYIYNTSSWVANIDWTVSSTTEGAGNINLYGKCTSTYVKEIRIPVARLDQPYDVRVTKLSTPNTANFFCDMQFESYIELVNEPLILEDLALTHMVIRASDQFSSFPTLTQDCEGRIIKVPSNYDPDTRVYSGIWDGTWKFAYSNNTAYVGYDLIMNDRYGLNAYYPIVVDPEAAYAFGRHCDAHGFTYNELISTPRPLDDAVNYILSTAGGIFVDYGDGYGTILFDSDDDPAVALFTPENVEDGMFTYSFTDITSRKNDLTVSYIDPDMNWITNRRRVYDADAVTAYGRNTEDFIAVGCISETEAIKRARLRLVISQTEKASVVFKTNRLGLYVRPYDVILIADPLSGFGVSGRIRFKLNSKTVLLRDAVTIEAGFIYTLRFQVPTASGYDLWTSTVLTPPGTTHQLETEDDLPDTLADKAVFTLESAADTHGLPKAYRVSQIDVVDGSPDTLSITALEVNRSKWAYVDGNITSIPTTVTGSVTQRVNPVSSVSVISQYNTAGRTDLLISWTKSDSALVKFTRIYYAKNGGAVSVLAEVRSDSSYLLEGVDPATYRFSLTAVSIQGNESAPVTVQFEVIGATRTVLSPSNLSIVDEPTVGVFNSKSPVFRWDASADPFLKDYVVEVLNPANSDALIRRDATTGITWSYAYTDNSSDGGGTPFRTFTIRVRARDTSNNLSAALTLTCTNPLPTAPTGISFATRNYSLYIRWTPSAVKDWAGSVVHVSSVQGFTPSIATLIYDGVGTSAHTFIEEGQTLYVRIGTYDNFTSTIVYAAEVSSTGVGLLPNSIAYSKLTAELQTIIDESAANSPVVQQLTTQVVDLSENVYGSWVVKIQTQSIVGGTTRKVISGFGLAQYQAAGAEATSDFVVAADRFSVISTLTAGAVATPVPVFVISTVDGVAEVGINGNLYATGTIGAAALNVNELSAISANIGEVTAGTLMSPDGKVVFSLTNGSITISD
jgi:hypothetical protein